MPEAVRGRTIAKTRNEEMKMRRLLTATIAAQIILAAPAWAYVIELSPRDIQIQVEKKFPIMEETDFYTLTLKSPKVDLTEGSSRVGLIVNALVESLAGDSSGVIHIDGVLKYVKEKGEFILADATARSVEIEGMSQMVRAAVTDLATQLVRDYFNKNPIYKLKPDTMGEAMVMSAIKSVEIRDGKLRVELGIP